MSITMPSYSSSSASSASSPPSWFPFLSPPRVDFLRVLPLPVSVSVLTFLPLSSIASCSAVSALSFVLCQDERVWRQLCATRWRSMQHARTLLTQTEWTAVYGESDSEGGDTDNEEDGEDDNKQQWADDDGGSSRSSNSNSSSGKDDTGSTASPLCHLSWKERYLAAEVDLCRSHMTVAEVTSARWAFRFLPSVGFVHNQSQTTFPVFTATRLITSSSEQAYDWRFVDSERDMPARARERGEMTAYERRRLCTPELIASIRTANRPYWLRSSGSTAPPIPAAARSPHTGHALPLSASSALLSPALPPYRFPPGHPFVRLSALQVADCSTERRLQVSHFPALSVSRLPDGGWQMLNQYVLFKSVHPDHISKTSQEDEEEEDEDGEDGEVELQDDGEYGPDEEEEADTGEVEVEEKEEEQAGEDWEATGVTDSEEADKADDEPMRFNSIF